MSTAADINIALYAAADTIPCPVCARELGSAVARSGEMVTDAQVRVIIATIRIAAHAALGHPPEVDNR